LERSMSEFSKLKRKKPKKKVVVQSTNDRVGRLAVIFDYLRLQGGGKRKNPKWGIQGVT